MSVSYPNLTGSGGLGFQDNEMRIYGQENEKLPPAESASLADQVCPDVAKTLL